jgi:multiple sugar transport system permease protein
MGAGPTGPAPIVGQRRQKAARTLRRSLVWYAFVLPPFALLLLFIGFPTAESFRMSFFQEHPDGSSFVGLRHYSSLARTEVFWDALGNTVLLGAAFLALVIPLAVVLATLLNSVRRGAAPLKVIYFLPQLTSAVAVAIIFNYVFQPDWGLLNGLLRVLGAESPPLWLADPSLGFTGSRAAVTILAVWTGLGYFILVFLAGLQSIPFELYEAAAIDGAGRLQIWRHITLPSLRPTFIFLIMTGTFDAMGRFSDLWTLGGPGGAPDRSLQTIVMYMFQVGFESGDVNLAAAVAVVFFTIMLGVTVVAYRAFLSSEFRAR